MRAPLLIVGMHRSGTSLTANWLAQCGLDVGGSLLPASPEDNPRGYFEARSFFRLHEDILESNGLDHYMQHTETIPITEQQKKRAMALLDERRSLAQWGWKEPRTTLFLDFWQTLIPEMKVLAVFRDYVHVADSLLKRNRRWRFGKLESANLPSTRRWLERWRSRAKSSYLNVSQMERFLLTWHSYNQRILDFVGKHPEVCLVVHIDRLIDNSSSLISFLNDSWEFSLTNVDIQQVYDPSIFHRDKNQPLKKAICNRIVPDCEQIYEELLHREHLCLDLLGLGR